MNQRSEPGEGLRLQQFGLKDSSYERPNQDWVCGRLCEGDPCAVGPDARGRCVAASECRPLRKGDRWVCTRRDAAAASCPCQEGPLPDGSCARPIPKCSPVRSIRAKRGRFAFAAFALTVGVLSYFLFSPERSDFIAPGELTDAHAQVLKAHRTQDCGACHVAGSADASHWLRLAFSSAGGASQNDKCLVCHLGALGTDAALAHSLPANTLAQLSAAAHASGLHTRQQVLASFAPLAATTPQGELACATCHQEHGGRHQNLKSMPDLSCQVCHKAQFESFAHGHPEFKAVRHNRAGILFDHADHQPRMPGAKLDCAQCHRPDPAGKTMQFTSFEQACVGCHEQGKVDHHGDQIRGDVHVVFQLPAMSLDKDAYWPKKELAPGSELTPMLQFLIAGDEDAGALQSLKSLLSDAVAKGSPDDWDAEPQSKAQLARAIKRVAKELSPDEGNTSQPSNRQLLRTRIARAAGVPVEAPTVAALLDQLTAAGDKTKSWQQHCLPQLAEDLAGKLAPPTAPAKAEDGASGVTWKAPQDASPWFIDPESVSVNYRPSHADAFDKSCIDLLASGVSSTQPPKFDEKMTSESFRAALRVRLLEKLGASCLKCHSAQAEKDAFVVNWHTAGHATQAAGYSKFDHRPHLTLFLGADRCSKCHQLEAAAPAQAPNPAASFLLVHSQMPNHGMAAHDKASCATCHTPTGSSETCLTCHVYHMTR